MAEIQPVKPGGWVKRRIGSSLAGMRALGYFDGRLRKAIHALKYSGRKLLAKTLAELLQHFLEETPWTMT